MLIIRPVMAMTTLDGLRDNAWGFPGRGIRIVELEGSFVLWRFKLQSHEAEMRTPCLGLYRTERTGAVCLLSSVFSPDFKFTLFNR